MSFFSYIFPYEKISLVSNLPQYEIMSRMNWLFTQSGGIPNSGGIRGWLTGQNMFLLESNYLQFGGIVQNNGIWLTIRMKQTKLVWFLIFTGLGLLSTISLAITEPAKNIVDLLGPIFVVILIYAAFMIYMVRQSSIIKRYLFQLLQANEVQSS